MQRWKHPLLLAYLIVIAGLLFYAYRLETLAQDTNHILNVEVQEKDTQIAQLTFMLNEQAVPAIVYMQNQLRQAGLRPPDVLIHPQEPEFTPPPKETP